MSADAAGISILAAVAAGILPFLIGTVALTGFTTVLALEHSREERAEQLAYIAKLLAQRQN